MLITVLVTAVTGEQTSKPLWPWPPTLSFSIGRWISCLDFVPVILPLLMQRSFPYHKAKNEVRSSKKNGIFDWRNSQNLFDWLLILGSPCTFCKPPLLLSLDCVLAHHSRQICIGPHLYYGGGAKCKAFCNESLWVKLWVIQKNSPVFSCEQKELDFSCHICTPSNSLQDQLARRHLMCCSLHKKFCLACCQALHYNGEQEMESLLRVLPQDRGESLWRSAEVKLLIFCFFNTDFEHHNGNSILCIFIHLWKRHRAGNQRVGRASCHKMFSGEQSHTRCQSSVLVNTLTRRGSACSEECSVLRSNPQNYSFHLTMSGPYYFCHFGKKCRNVVFFQRLIRISWQITFH